MIYIFIFCINRKKTRTDPQREMSGRQPMRVMRKPYHMSLASKNKPGKRRNVDLLRAQSALATPSNPFGKETAKSYVQYKPLSRISQAFPVYFTQKAGFLYFFRDLQYLSENTKIILQLYRFWSILMYVFWVLCDYFGSRL